MAALIELQLDIPLGQPLAQVRQLDVHDGAQLVPAQRMEHHDVVDAVDELRPEVLLHDLQHRCFIFGVVRLARQLLDHVRAQVRTS